MTEQKIVQRRKVLAKWLKESILRLGPTFIKIGQQFSTRVDILAQEYVDQLSELQVFSKIFLFIDMISCLHGFMMTLALQSGIENKNACFLRF